MGRGGSHRRLLAPAAALLGLAMLLPTSAAQAQKSAPPPPAPPPGTTAAPLPPPPPPGVYVVGGPQAPAASVPARRPRRHVEPYVEGEPMPPGAHVEERTHMGVWITGVSVLSAFYVLSASVGLIGLTVEDSNLGVLTIPVVGPFLLLGNDSGANALLIFDGVAQAVGLGLLIAGLSVTAKVLVYTADLGGRRMAVAPLVGPHAVGIDLAVF